jgi:hypothetical protein
MTIRILLLLPGAAFTGLASPSTNRAAPRAVPEAIKNIPKRINAIYAILLKLITYFTRNYNCSLLKIALEFGLRSNFIPKRLNMPSPINEERLTSKGESEYPI